MATPSQIPWPMSALPGRRPGDGQGDLINAYAIKIGDLMEIRRTPGLVRTLDIPHITAERIPRGMHALPDRLYHAWDNEMRVYGPGVTEQAVVGAFPGSDRVTFAHNNRPLGSQVVVVSNLAAYVIDPGANTIAAYPLPSDPVEYQELGSVTSVEYFAGYFVFTRPSGQFVVSDLQSLEIPNLSEGWAEYRADTLLRAKAMQSVMFLMSSNSIEVWVDVATMPMPFARQTSLDTGLLGKWCVAGGSNEWERGLFFIASDFSVRQFEGITPKIISNDDVSFDIYSARDRIPLLVTQVYTFEQQAVFSITLLGDEGWTWEFNVNTGLWHRRDSMVGNDWKPHWRGVSATQYKNNWQVQDLHQSKMLEVRQEVFSEDGDRMRFRCESGALKAFPATMRVPSIDIDCIVALGKTRVPSPFETNPAMEVSWSHDGGANWSRPVTRSMGRTGRFANKVTVKNLGRSTHHGLRLRCDVTDPVPATILGGVSTSILPSRPRQVDR